MPSFDEALQRAGEFGRFQRRVFLLLCLTGVTFAFLFVGVVFLGSRPERYWCRGPSAAALAERCGWSPEEEWNRTAPPERGGDAGCRRYLLEAANGSAAAGALSCADPLAAFPNRSAPLVPCRGGWRYVQAHSTIVSEVRASGLARGGGETPGGTGRRGEGPRGRRHLLVASGGGGGTDRVQPALGSAASRVPGEMPLVCVPLRGEWTGGGVGGCLGFGRERKPGRMLSWETLRTPLLGNPSGQRAARRRPPRGLRRGGRCWVGSRRRSAAPRGGRLAGGRARVLCGLRGGRGGGGVREGRDGAWLPERLCEARGHEGQGSPGSRFW